ncbi:monovalent cation/H(+) antiporter subunit G [Desulfofustis limnaeus]|jgi:multicomponent Na+:H+ antiporter subunit G|uniref:Sodium:proton antiporter n=1 Tax=Desulfofustis limnaeus TaxID=2740163 RepID=A0ABN6M9C8_9BACT|nr:monovalent cation/H(+) antiporter subunit G [Desulfofustis limnaeus]MDX9894582.1 monovalent cation/H(+) antiporter subunit G [Desulfofustis sp.]BDD88153.1 sodium:proton antiporter [Desulfofustis limnaeus]
MDILLDILSWILLVSGSFFCLTGGIGLLRFPDFFTRIHAASLTDTLGAGLILTGLMLQAGWGLVLAKLILILLFSLLAGTTASHAMSKASLKSGLKPWIADDDAAGQTIEGEPSSKR